MTNPFDDKSGIFQVLINDEGQYSLWPSFIDVPKGWTIIHKSDSHAVVYTENSIPIDRLTESPNVSA